MATNVARVKAALDAIYDENVSNPKLMKVTTAVIEMLTPEQIEAAYPGVAVEALTNEQKASFVLASLQLAVRNRVIRNTERKNMQAQQEARQAHRQAVHDAAVGL